VEEEAVITKENLSTNKPSPTLEPDENVKPIPFPRNCGTIQVHFTARAFPTPKRESQAPEEEEVISFCSFITMFHCVIFNQSQILSLHFILAINKSSHGLHFKSNIKHACLYLIFCPLVAKEAGRSSAKSWVCGRGYES